MLLMFQQFKNSSKLVAIKLSIPRAITYLEKLDHSENLDNLATVTKLLENSAQITKMPGEKIKFLVTVIMLFNDSVA